MECFTPTWLPRDTPHAHIKAIIPGCSIPVSTLLSQMERDPGEYIVDPWVIERETWVAIEADRLVAAVHLHRYGNEPSVTRVDACRG
jgi:hypothetical protein